MVNLVTASCSSGVIACGKAAKADARMDASAATDCDDVASPPPQAANNATALEYAMNCASFKLIVMTIPRRRSDRREAVCRVSVASASFVGQIGVRAEFISIAE